jgi:O-antigen/teichoic acid export membrane protein
LLSLGVLEVLFMFYFGIPAIELLFGAKWHISGIISKILVFSFALQLVITPFTIVFIAFEKIKWQAFWQISYFIAILSLYLIKDNTFLFTIKAYTIIDLIAYSVYGLLILIEIKNYEKRIHQ